MTEILEKYLKDNRIFKTTEIQTRIPQGKKNKAKINTELARLEKKGVITRIARGVYAVPVNTCFGKSLPNEAEIAKEVFLDKGNGYVSGASFLNKLGISSWMPQKTHIKSNLYRKNIALQTFVVSRPKVKITNDNYLLLQILDALEDMPNCAVDHEYPNKVIYDHIVAKGIDVTRLILICHKHYKQSTLNQLLKILEDNYESA